MPATWCFTDEVELPGGAWTEQAAAFELENLVPLDLEGLTCSYQPNNRGRGIVAAVLTEPVRSFLDALEREAISVVSLLIDAVLYDLMRGQQDCDAAILLDEGRITVISGAPGRVLQGPSRTIRLPHRFDAAFLRNRLHVVLGRMPGAPKAWRVRPLSGRADPEVVVHLLEEAGASVSSVLPADTIESLARAASSGDPPLDLRHDKLCYSGRWAALSRTATRCGVALAILLSTLGVTLHVGAEGLEREREALLEMQRQTFQGVHPGQPVPPGVALRLRSECIKLEGLTKGNAGGQANIRQPGAEPLERLCRTVGEIPPHMKLFVTELLVDETSLRMDGQTTAHNVAGSLVQAFNRLPDLDVDPPRTKLRKDKTVDFRIHARKRTDEGS
jgi:hypothetical protein